MVNSEYPIHIVVTLVQHRVKGTRLLVSVEHDYQVLYCASFGGLANGSYEPV